MLVAVVSQVVVASPYSQGRYAPTRLFLGPTANVLPDGTVWLYGGTILDNQFRDYGIWHGVLNVGLGDVSEVTLSVGRLLSNLPAFQPGNVATAMKIRLVKTSFLSAALKLKVSPGMTYYVVDTLVLFAPGPIYRNFLRTYRIRTASLLLPITIKLGRVSISASPFLEESGTRMEMEGLPSLKNCEGGTLCDSLRAWLNTVPFREAKGEKRMTFYGGYVGGTYAWRKGTDLLFELNALPKYLYRGLVASDTLGGSARYSPTNRLQEDTVFTVLHTFLGIRHYPFRNLALDVGVVIPYDTHLPPKDRLNLLGATIYLNFHLLFSLVDLEGF